MSFLSGVRRALPAVLLSATLASAALDTCWYPDGKTISSDVPCNPNATASACCSSQSYCFEGGLCVTGGLVTRGSCTDQTWDTAECADFCKSSADADGEVGITPCSVGVGTNTFVCGFDNSLCNQASSTFTLSSENQLILRPGQIEALVHNALASSVASPSSTAAATASSSSSTGALIGTAIGVAIPLLLALGVVSYLFVREKRKNSQRPSMYKLPSHNETKESLTIHPPPSLMGGATGSIGGGGSGLRQRPSYLSRTTSHTDSDAASFRTTNSAPASPRAGHIHIGTEVQRPLAVHSPAHSFPESPRTSHIPSFAERIQSTKVTPQLVDVRDLGQARHELDSASSTPRSPLVRLGSSESRYLPTPKDVERYELATSRMSR